MKKVIMLGCGAMRAAGLKLEFARTAPAAAPVAPVAAPAAPAGLTEDMHALVHRIRELTEEQAKQQYEPQIAALKRVFEQDQGEILELTARIALLLEARKQYKAEILELKEENATLTVDEERSRNIILKVMNKLTLLSEGFNEGIKEVSNVITNPDGESNNTSNDPKQKLGSSEREPYEHHREAPNGAH